MISTSCLISSEARNHILTQFSFNLFDELSCLLLLPFFFKNTYDLVFLIIQHSLNTKGLPAAICAYWTPVWPRRLLLLAARIVNVAGGKMYRIGL